MRVLARCRCVATVRGERRAEPIGDLPLAGSGLVASGEGDEVVEERARRLEAFRCAHEIALH